MQSVVTTAEGWFNLATRPSGGEWQDEWYKWPQDLDRICARAREAAPDNNVYFTAHLFSERRSLKSNVLPSRTIQADLDNAVVGNIKPNILIETSPGRHQGYWLLPDQKDPEVLEGISQQVTYNIMDADRSGWSLGHKMRLPGTLNHKYPGVPSPVRVLSATLVLTRLALETPEELSRVISAGKGDEWVPKELPGGSRELWTTVKPMLPRVVSSKYDIRQQDRSAYLFGLMCACFRQGLDRDQVFWIAKGSKNNKFESNRYHADYDLAKDVRRAERTVKSGLDTNSEKDIIGEVRKIAGTPLEKKQLVANRVRDLMQQQGSFIHTTDGMEWYIREDTGQPFVVESRSKMLDALLDMRYGLNATEQETRFVVSYLQAYTKEYGRRGTSSVLSHYDPVQEAVMVHGGRRDVYRIDGRGVHSLVNGDLDYLFPWKVSDAAFEPELNNPLPISTMFDGCFDNLIEATPQQALALIRTWLVFLLLRNDAIARPILALLGQPGSGKSTLFRRIYILLYGAKRAVNTITKPDDFDHAVSTDPFVVFDNVDTFSGWLPDKLATAAAPSALSKRKLYTNNDTFIVSRDALLGLTAHNPQFRREDIVDRLIMLNFRRLDEFKPESEIIGSVVRDRNRLWGGLIGDVQQVLRTPQPRESEVPQFRVNDFARIGTWTARALGFEEHFRSALTLNLQEQTSFNLEEEDILVDTISRWLKVKPTEAGAMFSAAELWDKWSLAARDSLAFSRHYRDAPRLGRKLWSLQSTLKTVFNVEARYEEDSGRRLWSFARKEV